MARVIIAAYSACTHGRASAPGLTTSTPAAAARIPVSIWWTTTSPGAIDHSSKNTSKPARCRLPASTRAHSASAEP